MVECHLCDFEVTVDQNVASKYGHVYHKECLDSFHARIKPILSLTQSECEKIKNDFLLANC